MCLGWTQTVNLQRTWRSWRRQRTWTTSYSTCCLRCDSMQLENVVTHAWLFPCSQSVWALYEHHMANTALAPCCRYLTIACLLPPFSTSTGHLPLHSALCACGQAAHVQRLRADRRCHLHGAPHPQGVEQRLHCGGCHLTDSSHLCQGQGQDHIWVQQQGIVRGRGALQQSSWAEAVGLWDWYGCLKWQMAWSSEVSNCAPTHSSSVEGSAPFAVTSHHLPRLQFNNHSEIGCSVT